MGKNSNLSGNLFTNQPLREKETSLSLRIKKYLDSKNIWNDRIFTGQVETKYGSFIRGAKKGTPDRLAIFYGLSIFIEVKRIGEKPTPEQLAVHDQLRASGAIVIVAQRLEEVEAELNRIAKQIKI